MEFDINNTVKAELPEELSLRVIHHRNKFRKIIRNRYLEMLPVTINYLHKERTAINRLKCEIALRNGYDVVIGEDINGIIKVLGYTVSRFDTEDVATILFGRRFTHEDINFTIDKSLIKPEMLEITNDDDCQTGDFIILKNKTLNYTSDFEIVDYYADELTEIVVSRFSLIMQAKILTFFIGDVGDETLQQLISDLYNGNPFVKTTKAFDPEDQIYTLNNTGLADNLVELKREYQNKISELNNMVGINSLAVDKASGVSDVEAKSNQALTASISNVYLEGRNEPFSRLNKRFPELQLLAYYDDEITSQLSIMERLQPDE